VRNKKLKFQPLGATDGLLVTMPCGVMVEIFGESVIEFTLKNFSRSELSVIELSGLPKVSARSYLDIEKSTGAKVFIS
jgi:hypothetical protein